MTKNMNFLSDFGVQPMLLAAQVVNFLVLLFILKKLLYAPILKILEKRKELIVKTIKNAEESERIYQEAGEKADEILANAAEESRKALDETKKMGDQMLEEYNKMGAEILERANQEALRIMEGEKERLIQQVRENVGSLVIAVVKKVTGKVLTKEDQKKLFEKEIRNIS